MPQRLTASFIRSLKPKKNRFIITDDKTPGLALVTNPNGKQYFYYRYRPSGSQKVVEEPIGNAAILSLSDARKAVAIKREMLQKGAILNSSE
jgi:Arm DNA-binding domain